MRASRLCSLFASLNQFSETIVSVSVLGVKPILETVPEVEQNKTGPGPLSGRVFDNIVGSIRNADRI